MADQPLVSIGIPTYNRADSYLPQALDSALAQTYPNIEVIVSDNFSTDQTSSLIRSRASKRLRYIRHEKNIGANGNFNYCLEQARGEYFLLLHDDLIDPDFVETCMAALPKEHRPGIIRSGTRVVDEANRIRSESRNLSGGLSPANLFLMWFDRGTAFYLCSTLFNTARLRQSGGLRSKTNLFQDVAAIARLAVPYGRLDIPGVRTSFRRHDANKGSNDSALEWAEDSLYLLDLLCDLMPEHAASLRNARLPYLCRKCYRNASGIPDPIERWRAYLTIYGKFEHCSSPFAFCIDSWRKWARTTAGRLLRGGPAKRPELRLDDPRGSA
jgi:glycosyltransferase involved in cell wall biosynthesis